MKLTDASIRPDFEKHLPEMTQTQHTPAHKAALAIACRMDNGTSAETNLIEYIIEEKTHCSEMLTFIEKVAAWPYEPQHRAQSIFMVQEEAFALIKKVRS